MRILHERMDIPATLAGDNKNDYANAKETAPQRRRHELLGEEDNSTNIGACYL